jgi:hypothetical protein
MDIIEWSIVAVGAFLAMAMFSTLYGKSNPLYALAEESYVGFATGLTIVINLLYIWRTGIVNIQAGDYILTFGLILGLMILLRINKKYNWIARLGIAVVLGAQFALSFRTIIFANFIQQISATIVPLFTGDGTTMLYRWTITICVVVMLTFFLYTIELKGPLLWSSKIGEYLLYISFGAIFAQTFMGRLGLFTGFMQNYTVPPWKTPILLASMIIVLAVVIILDKTKMIDKLTPED